MPPANPCEPRRETGCAGMQLPTNSVAGPSPGRTAVSGEDAEVADEVGLHHSEVTLSRTTPVALPIYNP